MDSGRTSTRILHSHAPNEGSNFGGYPGPAARIPASPSPEPAESSPMPGQDGARFHKNAGVPPAWPDTR